MPAPKLTEEARKAMGRRFAYARLEVGLSQQEVADALGVSREAVAHIENGRNTAALPTMIAAASLLGKSLDHLLIGRTSH